mgnify:FL=1
MDVVDRIKAVGGEFVNNKARVRVGDKRVVIARMVDDKMTLTPEGVEFLKTSDNKPKKAAAKPKKVSADDDS